MSVEAKRGCGYRRVGGLYLVGEGPGAPCDRMPIPLNVCPCCGEGIKFSRGWTWIQPTRLFKGNHSANEFCECDPQCPACYCETHFGLEGKAGLLWVGEKFYTISSFTEESVRLGVSKRIATVPHGFEIGKTWVFLAHKKAINDETPGIFMVFRPHAIEKIVTISESCDAEKMENLKKRGITPVRVPDGDPDHR